MNNNHTPVSVLSGVKIPYWMPFSEPNLPDSVRLFKEIDGAIIEGALEGHISQVEMNSVIDIHRRVGDMLAWAYEAHKQNQKPQLAVPELKTAAKTKLLLYHHRTHSDISNIVDQYGELGQLLGGYGFDTYGHSPHYREIAFATFLRRIMPPLINHSGVLRGDQNVGSEYKNSFSGVVALLCDSLRVRPIRITYLSTAAGNIDNLVEEIRNHKNLPEGTDRALGLLGLVWVLAERYAGHRGLGDIYNLNGNNGKTKPKHSPFYHERDAYCLDVRVPDRWKSGLHGRPSADLVEEMGNYNADITITNGGVTVNGKSSMGVMTLAAGVGTKLKIQANGLEAEEAIRAAYAFFNTYDGKKSA